MAGPSWETSRNSDTCLLRACSWRLVEEPLNSVVSSPDRPHIWTLKQAVRSKAEVEPAQTFTPCGLSGPTAPAEPGKSEELCAWTLISSLEKQAMSRNIWPRKRLHAEFPAQGSVSGAIRVIAGS